MRGNPVGRIIHTRVVAAVVLLAVCCGADTPIPVRIALVIGNGSYDYADPLPNALTDAKAIADRLGALGFRVEAGTLDLNHDGLDKALTQFGNELRNAGPNVVSLVYYAGHAAQDRLGINYFLPIDAKAGTPDDVKQMGVPLPPLLQAMEDANNDVNIVVIDACRDWFKDDRTADDPQGLADMGLHGSVLIAYATRAYGTADEGAGLTSSPYSHRFLEALNNEPNRADRFGVRRCPEQRLYRHGQPAIAAQREWVGARRPMGVVGRLAANGQ